jgi:D-3-phosphoglycerate dehydrogenase
MVKKFSAGKNLMSKSKVLLVGEAVLHSSILGLAKDRVDFIEITPSELTDKLIEIEGISALWIHFDTFLDASFLEKIQKIPFLVSTTTGLTHIAKEIQDFYGLNLISLQNRSDFLSRISSTAEHAWLLIMLWRNDLYMSLNSVKSGFWNRRDFFREQQLAGKTLGIIGFGRLGKILAKYGVSFSMNILVYEKEEKAISQAKNQNLKVVKSINELIAKSDIVSIHASYTPDQSPIITQNALSAITKPILLVNTSRGGLVDEDAIIKEIKMQPYLHYYTDVLKYEEDGTRLENSNLWKFSINNERIKITPHIGGANHEAALLCEKELLEILMNKLF